MRTGARETSESASLLRQIDVLLRNLSEHSTAAEALLLRCALSDSAHTTSEANRHGARELALGVLHSIHSVQLAIAKLDGYSPHVCALRHIASSLALVEADAAAIESGRLTPKREPVSPTALEGWLHDDARLAVDVEVQVRCEGLSALPALDADPELLRVLVSNLFRNAWKYAVRRPVTFLVEGVREGTQVVLRFTDNGPGIPLEARERVFEAFHRLAKEGNAGGSGLGLALARRIAVLHGGSLVISRSGLEGTTFELRFPVTG